MPITAYDLIEGRPQPITATMDTPILDVIALMQSYEYSQLPIIDENKKQKGIITAESILKAQKFFETPLSKLKVQHAVTQAAECYPDEKIFDVFERLNKHPAVLVVDNAHTLIGIITPWDAAAHLQQRAEDLMLVEDIENYIKDHILASFTSFDTGVLSQSSLDSAISNILDRSIQTSKEIVGALNKYFKKAEIDHRPKNELVFDAFEKFIKSDSQIKSFEELTLNQYIDLLLDGERWSIYGIKVFDLDASFLRTLLDNVRKIRNQLAHFRDEINSDQRTTLRFCRDFFERHAVPDITLGIESKTADRITEFSLNIVEPTEEELIPGESRYALLALFLQSMSIKQDKVTLTFEEVEQIIQAELPPSARSHRSWWANDSVSHVQSQQWLDASWRVVSVNLSEKRVMFVRSEKRNQMYIDFFSRLINELKKAKAFKLRDNANPIGVNWISVAVLPPNGKNSPASLNYTFARGNRFRIELYIDTGDSTKNKGIFDLLYEQREFIEAKLGEKLEWEKLVSKRASRVALYTKATIEDGESNLIQLQTWAVNKMILFEKAIAEVAVDAIRQIV